MSPLRIIIIAILIYIAYRLLTSGRNKARPGGGSKSSPRTMPQSDTLEEDPVCKKLVPSRQAVTMRLHGSTYYFCSEECCNTFRKQQGEHS